MQDYGLHIIGPKGADIDLSEQHVGLEKLLSHHPVACHLKGMDCIRQGLPVVLASHIPGQGHVAVAWQCPNRCIVSPRRLHPHILTASNSSAMALVATAIQM